MKHSFTPLTIALGAGLYLLLRPLAAKYGLAV